MEKVSLLNKLKTLKQWQLQQQLNFAQLKDQKIRVSQLNPKTINENKENIRPYADSQDVFLKLMKPNELQNALSSIHLAENVNTKASNESDEENLEHWHMSGLRTVVPQRNKFSAGCVSENQLFTPSESGDEGSVVVQGVVPFSDTDQEEDWDNIEKYVKKSNPPRNVCEDYETNESDSTDSNVDDVENTVIENYQPDHYVSNGYDPAGYTEEEQSIHHGKISEEDRPICAKFSRNSVETFEELIENELHLQNSKGVDLDTSTPLKPKKRNFLKRGEGLRRFQYGVLQQQKKEALAKRKKSSVHPGVPLKLNRQKLTQNPKKVLTEKSMKQEINTKPPINVCVPVDPKCKKEKDFHEANTLEQEKPAINLQRLSPSDMEMSFQNLQQNYFQKEEEDLKELDQFEALEEAAENISLSSNSSLVAKFLGKKKKEKSQFSQDVQDIPEETEKESFRQVMKESTETVKTNVNALLPSQCGADEKQMEFDDTTSWSDVTVLSDHEEIDDTIIDSALENRTVCSSPENDLPLMKRVISKKKSAVDSSENKFDFQETPEEFQEASPAAKESKRTSPICLSSINNSNQISDVVKQKLSELEQEIKRFRSENETLTRLRTERENDLKSLRKEIDLFQKQKDEEIKNIEQYRDEEMKKLKTERKIFDKYQKASRAAPNKKEREEIKLLKQENEELRNELKTKESRWNAAAHRLRCRINELEETNNELKGEIKILEQERLQRWKAEHPKKTTTTKNSTQYTKSLSPSALQSDGGVTLSKDFKTYNEVESDDSTSCYDSDNSSDVEINSGYSSPNDIIIPKRDLKMSVASERPFDNYKLPKEKPLDERSNGSPKQKSSERTTPPAINISEKERVDPRHNLNEPGVVNRNGVLQKNGVVYPDGKVEEVLPDGSKLITFSNGTRKQISADNQSVVINYFNGDIKKILPDKRITYFYDSSKTSHTTFPDGVETIQFPNDQIEKRFPDGSSEIKFPDNTIKTMNANGSEKTVFPDGTVQTVDTEGVRVISFTNGQKEIHTLSYKRREYPNGTVKTVYEDGRQETKYSSGRLRVKDKHGNLLVDTFP